MLMMMMMMTSLRNNMIRRWQTSLHTYHATHTHLHSPSHTQLHSRTHVHSLTQFNFETQITNCQKMTTQKCEQSIYKDGMIRFISNAAFNRPHKMLIDDFGYALELPNFSMYYLADCQVLFMLQKGNLIHDTIHSRASLNMYLYIFGDIRKRT